jgi:succinate dehydrogenase / fumarate reductase, flavoprotein subunit
MLTVSECIAKAALERTESRGGHTRDDFPGPDDHWAKINLALTLDDSDAVALRHQPLPVMPPDLAALLESS